MTLYEFLKDNEGKVCKIGSGTGFIFCDTVDDCTELAFKEWSASQKMYRTSFLSEIEKKYETFDDRWADTKLKMLKEHKKAILFERETERKNAKKEKRNPKYKGTIKNLMTLYETYLTKRGEELKDNLKRRMEYETNYLSNWKDYLDREVKEIYDSIDEEGTKICIFEGDEHGKWWTTEEYRTGIIK